MHIEFQCIDLTKNFEECVGFRRESYEISFGTLAGFEQDMKNYRSRMENRIHYFPQGNCHVVLDGEIIGQTEMKFVEENDVGYISFLFLSERYRGRGIGRKMIDYARNECSNVGKSRLRLSVSKSNTSALGFYSSCGFHCMGQRKDKPIMYVMELNIGAGA